MTDKKNNPSNYCLVILSEGAEWEGYQVREYGEPDAYGHRKKENVGEALASEIHARSSEETIVSDLTYDLRSGVPDFVDKLVASTFGTMALEAVLDQQSGLMAALVDGRYAMAADSRSGAGASPRGCRHHVQHRALPSELRQQDRPADLLDARLMFWNKPKTPAACRCGKLSGTSMRPRPTKRIFRRPSIRGFTMSN